MGLQADRNDRVLRVAVQGQVGIGPGTEHRVGTIEGIIGINGCIAEHGRCKGGFDFGQQRLIMTAELGADLRKALFNQPGHFLDPRLVDRDLDARLVLVVAPPQHVVNAQDRLDIWQKVRLGQKVPHGMADHRGAAQTAAHDHLEPRLPGRVAHHAQADVMRLCHGAVMRAAGDGNLELARQELEFRVIRGPLPQQFRDRARILDLIGGRACEMIRRHVAHAIAAGLDGMHAHIGQRRQDCRHIFQLWPVELDVLARGEMPVSFVPAVSDHPQLAHLARVQRAIGNGHAQHVGMQLQIQPVHQPQRTEFLFGERAVKPARDLTRELRHPGPHEGVVEV